MSQMAEESPPRDSSTEEGASTGKTVSLGDIIGIVVGGAVFLAVSGAGVVNIWRGRLWTGIFLIAAPTAVVLITTLPLRIRQRIPESVAAIVTLGLWAGFFWAACGGR